MKGLPEVPTSSLSITFTASIPNLSYSQVTSFVNELLNSEDIQIKEKEKDTTIYNNNNKTEDTVVDLRETLSKLTTM